MVKKKLIPNTPPKLVVVIVKALYYNVKVNPAPTSLSSKADMVRWLSQRNRQFRATTNA